MTEREETFFLKVKRVQRERGCTYREACRALAERSANVRRARRDRRAWRMGESVSVWNPCLPPGDRS